MALPLSTYSTQHTMKMMITTRDNKSRHKFMSQSASASTSFRDIIVGLVLIAFASPLLYVVGIWLGTNVTFSQIIDIDHATVEFGLQNIKNETAPCGAHKVREEALSSSWSHICICYCTYVNVNIFSLNLL